MIEGPGAGSVPRTHGFGAGRPKKNRRVRLQIRNNGCHGLVLRRFCIGFEVTFLSLKILLALPYRL
jgi:hypothetical protein